MLHVDLDQMLTELSTSQLENDLFEEQEDELFGFELDEELQLQQYQVSDFDNSGSSTYTAQLLVDYQHLGNGQICVSDGIVWIGKINDLDQIFMFKSDKILESSLKTLGEIDYLVLTFANGKSVQFEMESKSHVQQVQQFLAKDITQPVMVLDAIPTGKLNVESETSALNEMIPNSRQSDDENSLAELMARLEQAKLKRDAKIALIEREYKNEIRSIHLEHKSKLVEARLCTLCCDLMACIGMCMLISSTSMYAPIMQQLFGESNTNLPMGSRHNKQYRTLAFQLKETLG